MTIDTQPKKTSLETTGAFDAGSRTLTEPGLQLPVKSICIDNPWNPCTWQAITPALFFDLSHIDSLSQMSRINCKVVGFYMRF